ncbi:Rv2231c family pyridoxal phosphate-dependent protein CobC [Umezawaea endophytica]|uniref:Aminotransferase n=1 Tax=Umezawaea endophytica TaxID=1654476 RepID=A0A9X3A668_9PSEU|nr:Rv2231c family pyridoxal phosphate-dependent protein CobC [Umezawaea endophytica]MCS7484484.1 Rv2231c family pyridoxal phosphate-dependent protein CobC [Umezawaea endophytica]
MTSERALLRHHGDVDAAPGLVDFAVNVRLPRPPAWLRDRLVAALDDLGRYPTDLADLTARRTVAERHGRTPDEVLVLAGAAEGFALLPALRPVLAAVVHPSFTEPEVALADAGVPVHRVPLRAEDGYALRSDLVPDEADLVVIGNPTNPTSVLHPASAIAELARPGRVLVVDEAFADTVPGEPESLAGARLPGLLVLRSLTKTWGLAGLRAGYLLGDPALLARLAHHRPQWPVGSLVLEAVTACCEPEAVAAAELVAEETVPHTAHAARALADLLVVPPRAPFLLITVPDGQRVRESLRDKGFAVRRGDTFPGLTPDHLRVATRPPTEFDLLVDALRVALEER